MRIPRLSLGFSAYSDANLETKAGLVLANMEANPAFADPIPTLAQLQAALLKYSADLVAAAGLGRINVANKNASRQQLELLLIQLGTYVMYLANGNETILTSSGFSLTKMPQPRYITSAGNVTLSNGITSGQLLSSLPAVKGAGSYLHEIATEEPTAETVWVSSTSTRSQFTFNDLVPGKKYWVRVAAVGTRDQISYSAVVSQFVQ